MVGDTGGLSGSGEPGRDCTDLGVSPPAAGVDPGINP